MFGFGKKKATKEPRKNKCSGCEYFEGISGSVAICDRGHRGVLYERGCSDFTPDRSASCDDCYYNRGTLADIDCSIHGRLSSERTYCPDYAINWG